MALLNTSTFLTSTAAGVAEPGRSCCCDMASTSMEQHDLMAMPFEELAERLPAVLPESDQLARVVDASRQLTTGINKKDMRALSKQWGVAQKQNGKDRSLQELRNDIERKIRDQANQLLRQAYGVKQDSTVSAQRETFEAAPVWEHSGAEEPGENAIAREAARLQRPPRGGTKRRLHPEEPGARDEHVSEEVPSITEPLESPAVLKAIDWLQQQQRSQQVERLLKFVEEWRAATIIIGVNAPTKKMTHWSHWRQ